VEFALYLDMASLASFATMDESIYITHENPHPPFAYVMELWVRREKKYEG
jgi:hypothetical protein